MCSNADARSAALENAVTTNRKPEPTSAETYMARLNDIARLMYVLQQELDAHAPAEAQRTWPKAGDLGKVRGDLIDVVAFMGHMNRAQVEAFLAE